MAYEVAMDVLINDKKNRLLTYDGKETAASY